MLINIAAVIVLFSSYSFAQDRATGTGVGQNRNAAYNAARQNAMSQISGPKTIKIVSTSTQSINGGKNYITTVTLEKVRFVK